MNVRIGAALVFVGILIGCGVAAVAPGRVSGAQVGAGQWGCYVADRLPSVAEAAEWDGSRNIKRGLDSVAAHVPAGTILAISPRSGGTPNVICVKN